MPNTRKAKPKPTEVNVSLRPLTDFDEASFRSAVTAVATTLKPIHRVVGRLIKLSDVFQKDGADRLLDFSDAALRIHDALEDIRQSLPACATTLDQLLTHIDAWRANERRTRRVRFEDVARQRGWAIAGSWPEPVVQGIVFVVVDDAKDRATINGKALSGPATAGRLTEAVAAELDQLHANRTDLLPFSQSVWKAYRSCLNGADGSVSIFDLLAELTWQRQSKAFQRDPRSELFRPYPVAQFRADLTSYLAAGSPEIKEGGRPHRLEIVGGSFAQDGLFMYFPQLDRLATCGRLSFPPSDHGDQP
jgi:hypothetical protein